MKVGFGRSSRYGNGSGWKRKKIQRWIDIFSQNIEHRVGHTLGSLPGRLFFWKLKLWASCQVIFVYESLMWLFDTPRRPLSGRDCNFYIFYVPRSRLCRKYLVVQLTRVGFPWVFIEKTDLLDYNLSYRGKSVTIDLSTLIKSSFYRARAIVPPD